MPEDIERTIGALTAEVRLLREAVGALNGKVDGLVAESNVRKGERKAVYTLAAVISSICGWLASHVGRNGP